MKIRILKITDLASALEPSHPIKTSWKPNFSNSTGTLMQRLSFLLTKLHKAQTSFIRSASQIRLVFNLIKNFWNHMFHNLLVARNLRWLWKPLMRPTGYNVSMREGWTLSLWVYCGLLGQRSLPKKAPKDCSGSDSKCKAEVFKFEFLTWESPKLAKGLL